jgi:hypothetical protein
MNQIKQGETLIIQRKYGGLGDHLFYSHIPRIAKGTGAYRKVYISNLSEFRHPDYKRLIWEKNPYIDGFTDEKGIEGDILLEERPDRNFLDMIMLGLGLDDGRRFHGPELYFSPKYKKELADKSVYDPNYISRAGNFGVNLEKWLKHKGIKIDYQMSLRDKNNPIKSYANILQSKDLDDFCSIIVSCKKLYCLTSGTATLAAALKKSATVFYGTGVNRIFHHSGMHQYVFIPELFSEKMKRRLKKLIKKSEQ